MKILGISLGHDSNLALIENGKITAVMEAERYFRQKRYKLSAQTLDQTKLKSTFQYTSIDDLKLLLNLVKKEWGATYDAIAVQNQGRKQEFENLEILLKSEGFTFGEYRHVDHHLSHAALSFFTSPFDKALVLSYDGIGNDGKTVFFSAEKNKLAYLENVPLAFGQSYNNVGYILGIKPEIDGTTSGKTMGLTSYGSIRSEWIPYAREYVLKYKKLPNLPVSDGVANYGKGHRINAVGLEKIPELKKYRVRRTQGTGLGFKGKVQEWLGMISRYKLLLPGPKEKISQDLAATVQHVWTEEVLKLLKKHRHVSENLCVVGGCALNGTTNYVIEESGLFKQTHFIPNPSDCGLASGAALYVYYSTSGNDFRGSKEYYSPYLGSKVFDMDRLNVFKNKYPNKSIPTEDMPKILAKLVSEDLIVGFIRGGYEIGPRALGNRSILCNPLNKNMRDILNDKVKHREWYRPFAPIVTEEDSKKYFTNKSPVPYMSVICDTRVEYREKLPSITHIDGSARIQTVNKVQNPFIHSTLKEFEKITGMPVMLNTSFNPAGEPILNFCEVGLEMLDKTDLDLVIIENVVFSNHAKKSLLETL